ncbi:MAG: hypothetical protein AAGA30_21000, partial [Planctomycetota bacterium]
MLPLISGCTSSKESDLEAEISEEDSVAISAEEILATVLNDYRTAGNYEDRAVLYLTYRLEGRAIQEPHPWSAAWDDSGRYSADLFNSKIRCNGRETSCYVFDIETGNLDNQHLLLDACPISDLLTDSIAKHFLIGISELPLDEMETASDAFFLSPLLGFVDEKLLPQWMQKPEQLKLLKGEKVDGEMCYVLEIRHQNKIVKMWVGQESGLIRQMDWPLHYLDSEILAAKEVTSLRLFTRFHDARRNDAGEDQDLISSNFEIPKRVATKDVKQFVQLPPPLPVEKIGKKIGDVRFEDRKTKPVNLSSRMPLVLFWVDGIVDRQFLDTCLSVNRRLNQEGKFQLAIVGTGNQVAFEDDDEAEKLGDTEIPVWLDVELKVGTKIGLESVPSVVILNQENEIQFAKTIDNDEWEREVSVAIERVVHGEDLANEMLAEHQELIDKYHRELAAASSKSPTASSAKDGKFSANISGSIQRKWTSD